VNARDAAQRWTATWQGAWEAREADPIVALYAANARHWSAPAREPGIGPEGVRAYVERAFSEESEVRAWFGEPVVEGDRAAVAWWATLIENGQETTIGGTSMLRFDVQGLVVSQWDSWNQTDGRREPPPGWGSTGAMRARHLPVPDRSA
jgi:SnoaL-like domain